MKKLLFLFIIFLFTSCVSTKRIEIPYYYTDYNLEKFNNLYLIDILLNGKKTKLLVDTGASKSLLDISKSKQFGFGYKLISIDKYVGLGGLTDIYAIYDYNIDLFFITFLGVDLSEIIFYFNKDGTRIVGILGSDFLIRTGAIIDYTTNKLYLNTGGKVYINPIGNK